MDNHKMKNYLYHFEFFSGFYESYFYNQIQANNEKDAIISVVGIFINKSNEDTEELLSRNLGENWTTEKFWNEMELKFDDFTEAYNLIWIKEIDFDLDNIGKFRRCCINSNGQGFQI